MKKIKQGLSIHCHHDILVEYCYDYKERVEYIESNKPEDEQNTRLRLFELLPEEALKDIPKEYQEADQKRQEAYQYKKWQEAYQKWQEAYQKWPQDSKDAFHKKWCGCEEWNGKELVFKKL